MRLLLPLMAVVLLGGCVTNTTFMAPRPILLVRGAAPIFVVASGKRTRLATMFALNPDCSLDDYLTVRILSLPTHGEATVEQGRFYTNYPKNSDRSACNRVPSAGTAVWYRSVSGYVGDDAAEIEIIGTNGRSGRISYHIEVK